MNIMETLNKTDTPRTQGFYFSKSEFLELKAEVERLKEKLTTIPLNPTIQK
jgi:hypothetical protein